MSLVSLRQLELELTPVRDRVLELLHDTLHRRATLTLLLLGTLAARNCIALAFLCNRNLSAKLQRALTLLRHKTRKLATPALSRRARAMRFIPRRFGSRYVFFSSRRFISQLCNTRLET